MSPVHYVNIQKQQLNINSNNKNKCTDYVMVKCNNNTLKANPYDNTLKANPAVYKHTTIKTNAQIMYW